MLYSDIIARNYLEHEPISTVENDKYTVTSYMEDLSTFEEFIAVIKERMLYTKGELFDIDENEIRLSLGIEFSDSDGNPFYMDFFMDKEKGPMKLLIENSPVMTVQFKTDILIGKAYYDKVLSTLNAFIKSHNKLVEEIREGIHTHLNKILD